MVGNVVYVGISSISTQKLAYNSFQTYRKILWNFQENRFRRLVVYKVQIYKHTNTQTHIHFYMYKKMYRTWFETSSSINVGKCAVFLQLLIEFSQMQCPNDIIILLRNFIYFFNLYSFKGQLLRFWTHANNKMSVSVLFLP